MEKKTVIALFRAELTTSDAFRSYLELFPDAWFSRDGGDNFLAEFGHQWNSVFVDHLRDVFRHHFREMGVPEDLLPTVELTDSRRGSWIMEAALTMFGGVGTVYTVLKGISELSEIADGIEKTKNRLRKELQQSFRKRVVERIEPTIGNLGNQQDQPLRFPSPTKMAPPSESVDVTFSIDARPLRALTPDKVKSHSIHLAVGVSRSFLSVENLSDDSLENLRIGLFKSKTERHNWNFADAHSKSVPTLGGRQSIAFSIQEFRDQSGNDGFSLDDDCALYVDCWLQDNSGIYLFNFYLE